MSQYAVSPPAPVTRIRDLVELGKPRLSLLVIFTAGVGVFLAPAAPRLDIVAAFLLATSCLVAAGNTLNCWIEREIDGLMRRTRSRPLPAGRMEPRTALVSGCLLAVVSLTAIHLATNPLTTSLGAAALVSYVLVYTPLKRVTPWAVLVGAVPGALPPLMGWTAATGRLDIPGWFLFAVLFAWQLPHFIAISLYLKQDFLRAGLQVMSVARGDRAARRYMALFTVLLVAVSLAALPLGLAGVSYGIAAVLLGLPFLVLSARGMGPDCDHRWARRIFGYSLIYLPILITFLVLDTPR